MREIRPATQIAFLSGFDDFSYAQQAIQYNIISYLLKPISSSELEKELLKMKEKIDQKFQVFSQPGMRQEHIEKREFLTPLLLDGFGGELPEEEHRRQRQGDRFHPQKVHQVLQRLFTGTRSIFASGNAAWL